MTATTAQDFLIQRIKELLPTENSMVDTLSELLNVSNDSAYRRIRGETPLILDEAKKLCDHFGISLDELLKVEKKLIVIHYQVSNFTYLCDDHAVKPAISAKSTVVFGNRSAIG